MAWPGPGSVQLRTQVRHTPSHGPLLEGLNEGDFAAAREFNISLDRVNWLGNIMACTYIPAAALTPWLVSRYGVRRAVSHAQPPSDLPRRFTTIVSLQCDLGSVCLILAAWIRYAGTAHSLSGNRAYALLIVGQVRQVPHLHQLRRLTCFI